MAYKYLLIFSENGPQSLSFERDSSGAPFRVCQKAFEDTDRYRMQAENLARVAEVTQAHSGDILIGPDTLPATHTGLGCMYVRVPEGEAVSATEEIAGLPGISQVREPTPEEFGPAERTMAMVRVEWHGEAGRFDPLANTAAIAFGTHARMSGAQSAGFEHAGAGGQSYLWAKFTDPDFASAFFEKRPWETHHARALHGEASLA